MAKLSRDKVYHMLNLLRSTAERDCGHETESAARKIDELCRKYKITNFSYVKWTPEAEAQRQREKEQQKQRQYQAQQTLDYHRVSYTSTMKWVVKQLARAMEVELRYRKRRSNELYIYCNEADWLRFSRALARVKREWKRKVENVEGEMSDWIYSQSF